ncbi:MAG: hypothetical protein MZW92_81420 [Comamonadaceae bacterium]|nr:hypothetical protein [Comamonadaceae bacterium]
MAVGRGAVSHVPALTRTIDADRKLLAFIGHAGWICISAGLWRGRRATRTAGIEDCIEQRGRARDRRGPGGGQPSVRLAHPRELPVFAKALVERLHGG